MSAFHEIDSLSPASSTTPAERLMTVLVPLLFGCYSLWLGADSNWDLHNYHLYAAFAFLHDKLHTDLGAASFQGYFNPLLDTVFYAMNTHWPSRVAGFVLGAFHGLVFVLLLGIGRRVLAGLPGADRRRAPFWLALAGCLTANFLSGLGNTMGDDTTAVLCLSGVALLIGQWGVLGRASVAGFGALLGGGLLIGFAAGFKLTNAVFAVAGCAALVIAVRGNAVVRLRAGFVFGVGVLLGFAATGGYWMWQMWHTFGNPLFPQFSALFPNPLVRPLTISDTRWLPRNLAETVLWPFVISLNAHRVGEVGIRQVIWAIAYVLGVIWAARALIARFAGGRGSQLDPRAAFVVAYVAIGFAVWMKLFSIYRYIVPVEVLAPLVAYVLLARLMSPSRAGRWAKWLLGIATAVVLTGGAGTWGHEGWADPIYHAELPPLADPAHSTVLLVTAEQPRAWLVTRFPPQLAFVGINTGFPEGAGYQPRVHEIVARRGGPVYALLGSAYNWRADQVARLGATLSRFGIMHSERGCAMLTTLAKRLHLHASIVPASSEDARVRCTLGMRADDVRDIGAENHALVSRMDGLLRARGFSIVPGSCATYDAGIGTGREPYQFCRVEAAR